MAIQFFFMSNVITGLGLESLAVRISQGLLALSMPQTDAMSSSMHLRIPLTAAQSRHGDIAFDAVPCLSLLSKKTQLSFD